LAVIVTLYVIIVFEVNAHRAALPENEAYTEIGQWGPYVVAVLVFSATVVAKLKGWDFDNIQNRGFEWLLIGDRPRSRSRDSSEEGLLQPDQVPFIPLQDLAWAGEPIHLDVLRVDD
jgi:hypothetical protein